MGELRSSGGPLGVAGGACRPGLTGGVREEPGAVGLEGSGKPLGISRMEVWEAHVQVRADEGAPGAGGCPVGGFERGLRGDLCRIWDRMSSGGCFPPPVRAGGIRRPHGGGVRVLGVPAVGGRVAQAVAARRLEAKAGAGLLSGLLRLPAGAVRARRGGRVPAAVLEEGLGHRLRRREVLRHGAVGAGRQGGAGLPRPRRPVGGAVCQAVAGCAAGAA
jgi:hypothetical protein